MKLKVYNKYRTIVNIRSSWRAVWWVTISYSSEKTLVGSPVCTELFILHFNTSFYDPALRHSSFVFIIILILTSHNSLKFVNETVRGLTGGALANEPGFLGPVNSRTLLSFNSGKRSLSKYKGLRLAQAKNHYKIGSTYEIYFFNEIKKDLPPCQ